MSKRSYPSLFVSILACALGSLTSAHGAGPDQDAKVRQAVDEAMKPVIEQYGIPGLAVAVTIDGKRHFMEYGLASKEPQVPVTRDTLFELGSVSKTLTAALATYAEAEGKLSLGDSVSKHMPELKGSAMDNVRVLDLATHTAGGFPLQLPDNVRDQKQLVAYFRGWRPETPPGTARSYANPSVGLLGIVTAKAMGGSFETLMEGRLFPELGLKRTYITVPAAEMKAYAWGYNRDGKPVRVGPGLIATEAYGVKSNAVDMVRFLEVNMGIGAPAGKASGAVKATQTAYFRAGDRTQALIWEQYPGKSPGTIENETPVTPINPPAVPRGDVVIHKTGSTAGFGAYVAFAPEKKIGIVMLANKQYPNEVRVRAAHQVLSRLAP